MNTGVYTDENGRVVIVYGRGTKWVHCVRREGTTIRLSQLGPEECESLRPSSLGAKPYPVQRAARVLLGSSAHVTDGARQKLEELVQ